MADSVSQDLQPRLVNGRTQMVSAAGGLQREFHSLVSSQGDPTWIGYVVPMIPGERHMCCYDSVDVGFSDRCCGGCCLEGKGDFSTAES